VIACVWKSTVMQQVLLTLIFLIYLL
jgi:hypothetical protein